MKENTGEILQRLYDSEINVRIGWLWDGGVEYSIGSTSNDIWDSDFNKAEIVRTGEINLADGVNKMAAAAAAKYPKSSFAEWWGEE